MTRTAGFLLRVVLIFSALCFLGHLLPFSLRAAEIAVPKPSAKDKCPVCGSRVERLLPGLWSAGPGFAVNEQDLLLLRRA